MKFCQMFVLFIASTGALVHPLFAQSVWTESFFEDFRDGTFLDAGSNLYVSSGGRLQMINRWDFNGDGHLDILLSSGHGHTEKENTYIYLNNGNDIDGRSRIELPGGGSSDGVIADFNKDGLNDIAISNHKDSHFRRVNAWIYYGTTTGFRAENRAELPAYQGTAIAAGDFNGDSWLDLMIACQWHEGTDEQAGPKMSFIYWNSSQGFSVDNRLPLIFNGRGAEFALAGDLDNDDRDDLVALSGDRTYLFYTSHQAFDNGTAPVALELSGRCAAVGHVNGDGYKDLAVSVKHGVVVLFGDARGFRLQNASRLEIDDPRDIVLADFDGDGFDDIAVANFATPGGATWTDSYVFYSDGKDFSTREPLKLPTLGANGVSAGDLNEDGLPDLVFSNERITNQNNVLSYVYWNERGRFYFGNHTQLATQGSVGNAIGDVNNDGLTDVVFFNEEGGFRDGPATSHIYWGDGTRNFSIARRTTFHTHQIFGHGHADLDDDGFVDIVLAQAGFVKGVRHEQNGVIIHWGGRDGFSETSYLTMHTGYGGVRIADINRDGYLDMLAGGNSIDLGNPSKHGFPIFWGSADGFYHRARTVLHFDGQRIRGPLLMDLNRDNWLDIAGQVENGKIKLWWGSSDGFHDESFSEIDLGRNDHLMYIKGADFNKDGWLDLLLPQRGPPEGTEVSSFIYYGSSSGFSNDNRIEIPSYVPYQNSIADLDKDGWLDIFLTSYGGEVSGNRPSLIYWGSPTGFASRVRAELATYGASGSETADYDGDGWIDILIANHRQSGSYDQPQPHRHNTKSMLYWGGPDGFSPETRWEVEAIGPSGLNLRDVGNSYDRELYEDYVSSVYAIPEGEEPKSISWKAETPLGTAVKFQVRVAEKQSRLQSGPWHGPEGPDTWFTNSGSKMTKLAGNWIQYRARLITPNGGPTPYLTSVTIRFD